MSDIFSGTDTYNISSMLITFCLDIHRGTRLFFYCNVFCGKWCL